jgi:hypothetical protein
MVVRDNSAAGGAEETWVFNFEGGLTAKTRFDK